MWSFQQANLEWVTFYTLILSGSPTLSPFTPACHRPVVILHVCQDVEKVGEDEGLMEPRRTWSRGAGGPEALP